MPTATEEERAGERLPGRARQLPGAPKDDADSAPSADPFALPDAPHRPCRPDRALGAAPAPTQPELEKAAAAPRRRRRHPQVGQSVREPRP